MKEKLTYAVALILFLTFFALGGIIFLILFAIGLPILGAICLYRSELSEEYNESV